MEEPDGGTAEGAGVFGGEGGGVVPAVGGVAPEDAGGGDGDGGEAVGVGLEELPGTVAAEGEAGEVGAVGVGLELALFLVEGGEGELEHVGVGPEVAEGALGHDDDEGPALGVVAELGGKADLGLPHAFGTAFAAAVEEEDDGEMAMVGEFVGVAVVLREVDLELVGDAIEGDGAVEEAGFLGGGGWGGVAVAAMGVRSAGGQGRESEDCGHE